jgi:hypothetical protein
MSWRARIALGWGGMAFAAALALSGAAGIPADEAATMSAGVRTAGWLVAAPRQPAPSIRGLAELSADRGRPLLAETFHGFAGAAGERLGLGPIRGLRLGAALVAGLLAAALALGGFALGGAPAALLAPAIYWFTPRTLSLGLLATPDLLGALLWLVAVQAFSRSLAAATGLARTHAGLWSALLCAAAAAVRPDLASLWVVLSLHWGLGRFHLRWLARHNHPTPEPSIDWATRLRRVPTAIGAALVLTPAAVLACWPTHWSHPLRDAGALLAAVGWGQPSLTVNPAFHALAALPAPTVALLALGVGHAMLRLARALRHHDGDVARLETLWLLAGTVPLLLAAAGIAPRLTGLSPAVHALAPLALLGARALVALAELAWPERRLAVIGALSVFLLYPGLRAAAATFPLGASAWGEPLGGLAGAARRGWPRQDGGEAVRGVLGDVALHAAPGARVLWMGAAPWAIERYRRAGLVRADLPDAASLAEADIAVVARDGARDAEYEAWTAFGTSRAVSALFLDEVALVQVYARPGAWR